MRDTIADRRETSSSREDSGIKLSPECLLDLGNNFLGLEGRCMVDGIDRQSWNYGCWGMKHWHSSMALWNK